MLKDYNNIWLGTAIGILTSIIGVFVLFLIKYTGFTLSEYFFLLSKNKSLLAPLISLAGIPNLIIFFFFLNKNKYKTARGLILATLVLALFVLFTKVFL